MFPGLYVPLALVAAVVGAGLSLFAWFNRDTPGGGPLSLFLLSASVLAVTQTLSLTAVWEADTVLWGQLAYAVAALVPLAWLLTVVEYAGKHDWITPRTAIVLLVEPVVFSALLWTNDTHGLIWSDVTPTSVGRFLVFAGTEGLGFWAHLVYAYLLVAVGAGVLFRLLVHENGTFRDQATALLAAITLPMVVNALYVFGFLRIDPTGVAFVLSGIVLVGAVFRGQLLHVSPATRELGREQLADDLDEPVVIVDTGTTVVDVNPSARALLDQSTVVGRPLERIEPDLGAVVEAPGREEITLDCGGQLRYYDVRVSEFHRAYGVVSGYIVSLRDVTERTRREQRLDVMNRLFRHNLRNEMNVVRGNAELIAHDTDDEAVTERTDRIIDTVDEVIDRSDKLGRLSRSLDDETPQPTADVKLLVESAITGVREDHPDAEIRVEVSAREGSWEAEGGPPVEIALSELLENAAVHHHDPPATITVTLAADPETVTVEIADDGPGIPEQELSVIEAGSETPLQHASGVGLWMARWLVERAGGTLDFENDGGTRVRISLPSGESTDAPSEPPKVRQ
jgi:signal transduction histidine kinase